MAETMMRVEFRTEGFQAVLTSAGVDSLLHSLAVRHAAEMERAEGRPYTVSAVGRTRSVYSVRPDAGPPRRKLTHEEWMGEVWPRVGGAAWRPHTTR